MPDALRSVRSSESTIADLTHLQAWCEQALAEGPISELSDRAAFLIAEGHLDDETRRILANRRRAGRGLPSIGGFAKLRLQTEMHSLLVQQLRDEGSTIVRVVLACNASLVAFQLEALRSRMATSTDHYARGPRSVRRDRRDAVHLSPAQRDQLFEALQRTPAPLDELAAMFVPSDQPLVSAAVHLAKTVESVALSPQSTAEEVGTGQFADRYDTLLYVAGSVYDRIRRSAVWRSDDFALQRNQLNLDDELVQIALDTTAVRTVSEELEALSYTAVTAFTDEHLAARRAAVEQVWDQLVERVCALQRVSGELRQTGRRLNLIAAQRRMLLLDSRLDAIAARSAATELATANTQLVADQFASIATIFDTYPQELRVLP